MTIELGTELMLAGYIQNKASALGLQGYDIRAWHTAAKRDKKYNELVINVQPGGRGGVDQTTTIFIRTSAQDTKRSLLYNHYTAVQALRGKFARENVGTLKTETAAFASSDGFDARINGCELIPSEGEDGQALVEDSPKWATDIVIILDSYLV
tara:strand:+ start:1346 stop:1804 length:459 start_codon:yes stop_codon:yes gene_type:complete